MPQICSILLVSDVCAGVLFVAGGLCLIEP